MADKRPNPPTGTLNSRVELASNYRERPNLTDSGTNFTWDRIALVWANITPVGTQVFLNGVQTDNAITHRVTIRWRDDVQRLTKVIRESRRPDDSLRREVYQVKRVGELNGEKQFLVIDVTQEAQS